MLVLLWLHVMLTRLCHAMITSMIITANLKMTIILVKRHDTWRNTLISDHKKTYFYTNFILRWPTIFRSGFLFFSCTFYSKCFKRFQFAYGVTTMVFNEKNVNGKHLQTWKPWCFLCRAWTLLRSRAPSSLNIRAASFSWIQALVSSTFRLKAWISLARSSASSRELVLSLSVSHMVQTSSMRFSIACCKETQLLKQRPLFCSFFVHFFCLVVNAYS